MRSIPKGWLHGEQDLVCKAFVQAMSYSWIMKSGEQAVMCAQGVMEQGRVATAVSVQGEAESAVATLVPAPGRSVAQASDAAAAASQWESSEESQSPSPTASKENEGGAACGSKAAGNMAAAAEMAVGAAADGDCDMHGCSGVASMAQGKDAEATIPQIVALSGVKDGAGLSPTQFLLKEIR
jgi:hypothetical protein